MRLSGIFNATENFRICRLKNYKCYSVLFFCANILPLGIYPMVSKLNRDQDVFGRNSCLGYHHILPHVMLDVSAFSVVVIDFSGPCLIGSRNSFSLRCLAEHIGAVPQSPFVSSNAAITIPCPSVPSPLPLAVPAHLLLQQSHSAQPTGVTSARPHTPQCSCEGSKTVRTTAAKEDGTTAAKQFLMLLQEQGNPLTLSTIHSLDKGLLQPPPCCSVQAEHGSETQASDLLLIIRCFLSLRSTSRLAVAKIRALDRKLKIDFENLILYNIRMKSKNLRQGTTLLCTHEGI